jgi:hypothetical protein
MKGETGRGRLKAEGGRRRWGEGETGRGGEWETGKDEGGRLKGEGGRRKGLDRDFRATPQPPPRRRPFEIDV